MIWMIILAVVIAALLYVLHFGYKLAFYYEDPQDSRGPICYWRSVEK